MKYQPLLISLIKEFDDTKNIIASHTTSWLTPINEKIIIRKFNIYGFLMLGDFQTHPESVNLTNKNE